MMKKKEIPCEQCGKPKAHGKLIKFRGKMICAKCLVPEYEITVKLYGDSKLARAQRWAFSGATCKEIWECNKKGYDE
jgi:hypothetical protein